MADLDKYLSGEIKKNIANDPHARQVISEENQKEEEKKRQEAEEKKRQEKEEEKKRKEKRKQNREQNGKLYEILDKNDNQTSKEGKQLIEALNGKKIRSKKGIEKDNNILIIDYGEKKLPRVIEQHVYETLIKLKGIRSTKKFLDKLKWKEQKLIINTDKKDRIFKTTMKLFFSLRSKIKWKKSNNATTAK